MRRFEADEWALVLGASSGIGLASALKLAREGMSVCAVHRDLRGAMDRVEAGFEAIRATGSRFFSLNLNALVAEGVTATLSALRENLGERGRVRVLLHSIAYGNLKPIAPPPDRPDSPLIEDEDMARTVYAMGTSLLTWTRTIRERGLFAPDARVIALTSEGNEVAWQGYAAVSAAKAALESLVRSIAVEMGPYGIRANAIQAGVTDTPAMRMIPGAEGMKASAARRNPLGRLTRPEDVADAVFLLSTDEAHWVNGALLRVDGGERVAPA